MTAAANPWIERRVLCYAHQGGAREAPSSTLLAMRHALANGATAIELDVHCTRDGQLVVCHDPTVDRTTNRSGAIAVMTLAEVQALDNAYWFAPGHVVTRDGAPGDYEYRGRAPDDADLAIPTLRSVLETFPGVFLNLDIKQTSPTVAPYEHLLAELLRAYGRTTDVIVASFLDNATDAFATSAPEISTSAGTLAVAQMWRAVQDGDALPATRHHAVQVPPAHGDLTIVDERFVARLHDAGLAVHVWTIDDADEMRRLLDLGVDGIMTDCPSVLTAVLAERGAAYAG